MLQLRRQEARVPGPGEVRVRVYRSGVNPTDWKARRGSRPRATVYPPQVPGQDGAGIVDAVGDGADPSLLGSRVWIWEAAYQRTDGTAQDYTVVPASRVVALGGNASFDLGASLGIPYMTAHRCLTLNDGGPARLGPNTLRGRRVLVAGGAGAVGHAAIQLAAWSGAEVLATVSGPEKGRLATLAGASHVLNYKTQRIFAECARIAPLGVHTVVEVAPEPNLLDDARLLAPHGTIATYSHGPRQPVEVPFQELMARNARWQFILVYTAPEQWKRAAVEDIQAAVADGAVGVGEQAGLPLHHYSLEDTASAHQSVEDGVTGKVLIDLVVPTPA